MTVADQNPTVAISANGTQTVFPFGFRTDYSSLINVYVGDAAQGTFTVYLNPDQNGSPGGTVTLPSAPSTGAIVNIERQSPEEQDLALTAYTPFPAASVSLSLDDVVMMMQELRAIIARALSFSRANAVDSNTLLPAPSAGGVLSWVLNYGTWSLVTTSLFSAPVVTLPGGAVNWARNEVLSGVPGTVFTLAHTPVSGSVCLYLSGIRVSASAFSVSGNTVTFTGALSPQSGQELVADYLY